MKKFFFYFILLSVVIFINCRKEENKPKHNQLIVTDRNGNTTTSKPIDAAISKTIDPAIYIQSTQSKSADQYGFGMAFRSGNIPGHPVTFNSTGNSDDVSIWIDHSTSGSWIAIDGTAEFESSGKGPLFMKAPHFIKVTLHNVTFIRNPNQYPSPPLDTIWASGIINAYQ